MKKFKHILLSTYLLLLHLLPLRKMIVFEAQGELDDNPRAVFEYLIKERKNEEIKLIWIVDQPNYYKKACKDKNVRFVNRKDTSIKNQLCLQYYLSIARWFVFSHPWWYQKRRAKQVVIDTGHGIAFKGGMATNKTHESFDWYTAPSPLAAKWASAFWHMPIEKVAICGTPRNDELFISTERRKTILQALCPSMTETDKAIICMPTYRQSEQQRDSQVIDRYCIDVVQSEEEFACLNEHLRNRQIHLLIKPHPLQVTNGLEQKNLSNIHYINNQLLREQGIRLNNLLAFCDGLITDLSSVFFDYLLLDRPIGFLTKDLNAYSRGFLLNNPFEYMPGKHISSFEELLQFVDKIHSNEDEFAEDRETLNKQINGRYLDKCNCESFVSWMLTK